MRRLIVVIVVWLAAIVSAQAQTTPVLSWSHDGAHVTEFQVIVDGGTAQSLGLPTPVGTTYTASLPTMTAGVHTLAVRACNGSYCSSTVTITVVVLKVS